MPIKDFEKIPRPFSDGELAALGLHNHLNELSNDFGITATGEFLGSIKILETRARNYHAELTMAALGVLETKDDD